MTTVTTRLAWKRIAPGYYEARYTAANGDQHEFRINHRQEADRGDGYGRTDDWILAHTGPTGMDAPFQWDHDYPSDPIWTYREAKGQAEFILGRAEGVA